MCVGIILYFIDMAMLFMLLNIHILYYIVVENIILHQEIFRLQAFFEYNSQVNIYIYIYNISLCIYIYKLI